MLLNIFFFTIILLVPNNLGKHFIERYSYVNGLLVDYLVPTLYLQDIIILLFLVIFVFTGNRKVIYTTLHKSWLLRIILLFFIALYLSTLVSSIPLISLYYYVRLLLYAVFAIIVGTYFDIRTRWVFIAKTLSMGLFVVCLVAIGQWFSQGSLFDNYLVFGEQPYNYSTYGVSKESFFGKTVIPPYGFFRHPNILAGYIVVVFLWLLASLGMFSKKWCYFVLVVLAMSLMVLFLTLSITAFVALFTGLVVFIASRVFSLRFTRFITLLLLIFFSFIAFSLPPIAKMFPSEPSLYRRVDLATNAQTGIAESVLFGHGLGTGSKISGRDFKYLDAIRHPQPVHNIYLLMFLEGGMFSFIFYILLFLFLIFNLERNKKSVFSITFLQFFIMGLFDHYILTIHQTNILFWLTLSFYSAYNYNS